MAHDILKLSFDNLNSIVKNKIDEGTFDGITYSPSIVTEENKLLQDLFNQRLSIVGDKVNDKLVGHERENEIKTQVDNYLQKLKNNKFLGSNLEFEALCAFFNINGEILTLGKQSKLIRTKIDKTRALEKFSMEDIQLDNTLDAFSSSEDDDKTIYLSLIDKHFISTIPWESFRKTSYNYLFQNNEFEVCINYPKGTYTKITVSDFHMGPTMSPMIDNIFLEGCHNYIQWLFPNMKISEQVPNSQKYIFWRKSGPLEVPTQLKLNSDDVKFIKSIVMYILKYDF